MENEKNMAMPEFTNEEVEKAIKQFLDEKSNENMANLMQAMRDTRFLVPADFPPKRVTIYCPTSLPISQLSAPTKAV